MKKMVKFIAMTLVEMFLVFVILVAIYLDYKKLGISLHPAYYCITTFINIKLLDYGIKNKKGDGVIFLMLLFDGVFARIFSMI